MTDVSKPAPLGQEPSPATPEASSAAEGPKTPPQDHYPDQDEDEAPNTTTPNDLVPDPLPNDYPLSFNPWAADDARIHRMNQE